MLWFMSDVVCRKVCFVCGVSCSVVLCVLSSYCVLCVACCVSCGEGYDL